MNRLKELLIRHEGIRNKPYRDTMGKLTIGVGRNLDDVGISPLEINFLLENDILKAQSQAAAAFHWFNYLTGARRDVIISMIFNLGVNRFKDFKKMIAALEKGQYATASEEMLKSKWASQVGDRAVELSEMMKLGTYRMNLP